MEFSGSAIVAVFRAVIGTLIPPVKKKFFDQPKLYLVFQHSRSGNRANGWSDKNDSSQAIFVTEVIHHNNLHWEYNLVIRNNTEIPAYNIKIIQPTTDSNFFLHPNLDSLKPLLGNSEISYTAKFLETFEGKSENAKELSKHPPKKLTDTTVVLEYTNSQVTKFYTKYHYRKSEVGKHEFVRKI